MFLFRNPFMRRRIPNPPSKAFRVKGTDIEAAIWRNDSDLSMTTYRFKLSRVGKNGRRLSALSAKDVLLLPSVIAKLCEVFSESNLDEQTRARLVQLQVLLEELDRYRRGSEGEAILNTDTPSRSFLFL